MKLSPRKTAYWTLIFTAAGPLAGVHPAIANPLREEDPILESMEHRQADHQLLAEYQFFNRFIIRLSELALRRSRQADLRAYAETLIKEHETLERQLTTLTLAHGFWGRLTPLSDEQINAIRERHRMTMRSLSATPSQIFDQSYLETMLHLHEEELTLLETKVTSLKESEIRAFFQKAIVTLRHHLATGQSLNLGATP